MQRFTLCAQVWLVWLVVKCLPCYPIVLSCSPVVGDCGRPMVSSQASACEEKLVPERGLSALKAAFRFFLFVAPSPRLQKKPANFSRVPITKSNKPTMNFQYVFATVCTILSEESRRSFWKFEESRRIPRKELSLGRLSGALAHSSLFYYSLP